MVFDLVAQGGADLVQIVAEAKAVGTVYALGKRQYDRLKGFIGDRQVENASKLSKNTAERLKDVTPERLSTPSPSLVTPLLEAAVQESREELQEMWAALLANALIDNGKNVRRDLINVLSKLEPQDAVVLKILNTPVPAARAMATGGRSQFIAELRATNDLSLDEWAVSVAALAELKCLDISPLGHEPTVRPLARMLLRACEVY